MNELQRKIVALSKIDPLSEAEGITGNEYKDDKLTISLGLRLHIAKGEKMRALLSEADDTQFQNTVENYLRIVGRAGFEVVLCDLVKKSDRMEHFYILFNKELGILISFDTHKWENKDSAENVNSGNILYNWLPNDRKDRFLYTSSGGFEDSGLPVPNELVWIGSHDCREAAITNISGLAANGTFFPKWVKQPFFWFVAHSESKDKGYDYEAITGERYSRLPSYVKDQVGLYRS
jgi:hypothetical protein